MAISIDRNGYVCVSGPVSVIHNEDTSYKWYNWGIIRYDRDGNQEWATIFGDTTYDYFTDANAVDSSGNVLVVGSGSGKGWVVKYASNGNIAWVRQLGKWARGSAVDWKGNVAVTGETRLSSTTAPFTAMLDSVGNQLWMSIESMRGTTFSIGLDSAGNVYVAG